MTSTVAFQEWIDEHQDMLVERLADCVAIPSISGDPTYRKDVFKMSEWLENLMVEQGVTVERIDMGTHLVGEETLPLPPVLFGTIGNDPTLKTILVYGHYDVQPAAKSDGWNTEPFELKEIDGVMYGRGSSDDKGPVISWFAVLQAHRETNTPLPVNLKMIFEGMEESGSEGLQELVEKEASGFLKDVDAVCISDNYWLGTTTPAVTYGLRGLVYFEIKISGPGADLHSGVFGGTVHEPMTDLFILFSKLVTPAGEILIPGLDKLVAPLTAEERARYDVIDITVEDIESAVGGKVTISTDKTTMLMARMRYPSLSIHGIEGAFSGVGAKTVIPAKVNGKFSIRLVPDMTPDAVHALVKTYLDAEFKKIGTKNTLKIEIGHSGFPWVADVNHWNYRAAIKATELVLKKKPDLTREGGSIPITTVFADALGKSVLLLPMGRGDDSVHGPGEKLDRSNYIEGAKLLGEYLHQVKLAV